MLLVSDSYCASSFSIPVCGGMHVTSYSSRQNSDSHGGYLSCTKCIQLFEHSMSPISDWKANNPNVHTASSFFS